MASVPEPSLRLISQLLHDATLEEVRWDQALATITLRFDCLRRGVDGSDLNDRIVEFHLTGVEAVLVGYDSISQETRPSQFDPRGRITVEDMANWPYRRQEASLWFNSNDAENVFESAKTDWLEGDEATIRQSPYVFCLNFDQWGDFGMPMIHVRFLFGGDQFSITSGGVPLDPEDWTKQFEAWWTGWQKHWASKNDDEPSEYNTTIPAGEPEPPDLSYRPPSEPVFAIQDTDTPSAIISPIQAWFESLHERDWMRMARAYLPTKDTVEEDARRIQEWNMGHYFGHWGYARCIDEWWIEGRRACVIIRGIEHQMPLEGDPAKNREIVWTFALRQRCGEWGIYNYSQGWPNYGSGKKQPKRQKPWLRQWKAGKVC